MSEIKHIMLDLETWGVHPGCDLRSIGAVVFDPVKGWIEGYDKDEPVGHRVMSLGDKFYRATENPFIEGHEQVRPEGLRAVKGHYKYPLHRNPETVKWWADQSAEAQAAFENPVYLPMALTSFGRWLSDIAGHDKPMNEPIRDIRIWANDPHFDVSILDAAYRACGLPVPWHYRTPRSMATIVDISGMTREDREKFRHGTAHHALDDAISQAMVVCEAYKRLGLTKR